MKTKPLFDVVAERMHQGCRKTKTFRSKKPVLSDDAVKEGWRFVDAYRVPTGWWSHV